VQAALPERSDLFTLSQPVHDADGQVQGYQRLDASSSYQPRSERDRLL